jgi:transposase
MDIFGIGPAGAARILADIADISRFPDRNHFASVVERTVSRPDR